MKKASFFLILVVASLSSLVALFLFLTYSYPSYPDWMSDMWGHMGGMMGGTDPLLGYFELLFVILIVVVVIGVSGLVYFLFFPELKSGGAVASLSKTQAPESRTAIESISKTLTVEENKILQVLENHNGKYLQKYIRKEAKLSRLKTHRVLARLAERGIVTLEKTGNTNQVQIADWLKKSCQDKQ